MSHHERNDASFDLPDKITVRQQLAYFGAAASMPGTKEMFSRYWDGAKQLIQNWKCGLLPDLNTDLDEVTNPDVTSVIVWAALEVKRKMDALEELPKN